MLSNNTLKIFLVNEDVFCLAMYQQLLENMGYNDIHVFTSEQECLDNIGHMPDIVLLHYNMHLQPGTDMLKSIKDSFPGIYVVIISGNENKHVIDDTLKQGAFDYIVSGQDDVMKIHGVLVKIRHIQSVLNINTGYYKRQKDANNTADEKN